MGLCSKKMQCNNEMGLTHATNEDYSKAAEKCKDDFIQNEFQVITDHIEQCLYMGARFIGACAVTAKALRNNGRMPGFVSFLEQVTEVLSPCLLSLKETRQGKSAALLIPYHYSSYFDQLPSFNMSDYSIAMGNLAFLEATCGEPKTNFRIHTHVLMRTAEMAIAETLSLLKVAMEQDADSVVTMVLDHSSYLLVLSSFYLLLQVNLNHIYHQDSVVFIPDGSLEDDSERNTTYLRFFDYDVNDSSPVVPKPQPLVLMFMANENRDIALGHFELDGISGTICRTDDPRINERLEGIAENYVRGIAY